MRASLRILAVLILAFFLAWLATSLIGSGGSALASQSDAALGPARRFETTSWLSLTGLQVIAATAGSFQLRWLAWRPARSSASAAALRSGRQAFSGRSPRWG
jgi:hypothetical protein